MLNLNVSNGETLIQRVRRLKPCELAEFAKFGVQWLSQSPKSELPKTALCNLPFLLVVEYSLEMINSMNGLINFLCAPKVFCWFRKLFMKFTS